ncbi:hypothetical protein AB1Y20_003705 [Prymnesium parvum]|uniref:Uncharacterized protein n=1 Tax=Prymnesium parvum TaxID=97485 RepID=A0AB34J7B3_PRYPA
MAGKGNRGSYRASKAGRTRDRKGPAHTLTKARAPLPTAHHVGTTSRVSPAGAPPVDEAQQRRRTFRAAQAKAAAPALTPAAAALLATLRSGTTQPSAAEASGAPLSPS